MFTYTDCVGVLQLLKYTVIVLCVCVWVGVCTCVECDPIYPILNATLADHQQTTQEDTTITNGISRFNVSLIPWHSLLVLRL